MRSGHTATQSGIKRHLSFVLIMHPLPHRCHHQGFEKTGLGERIATLFVRALGKSTLGLSIGLNVAEALMAPAMPSTSARAGGIFVPIIKSLANSAGSEPGG